MENMELQAAGRGHSRLIFLYVILNFLLFLFNLNGIIFHHFLWSLCDQFIYTNITFTALTLTFNGVWAKQDVSFAKVGTARVTSIGSSVWILHSQRLE